MGYNSLTMQQNASAFLRHLPALRWVGGSCLVLLYLLTAIPLTPTLTALLAMADRSHQVAVQPTAHGIQVVLRHVCFNSPAHRHGLVARALTLFAQRPVEGRLDHVIQFAASPLSDQAPALILAPASDSPAPELLPPSGIQPRPSWLIAALMGPLRPPSDASGALVNVRSTVLLI